jgi:hypothetical protein
MADKWGILLPVCCRDSNGGSDCLERLREFAATLDFSLAEHDRPNVHVIVGIDQYDIFFDHPETIALVKDLFASISMDNIHFVLLRSHFRGKLCKIWEHLAVKAVEVDCSFFVFLGDDIRFLSIGWKDEIEEQFHNISASRKLPFGVGCVAFRDVSFRVFPTFPVIHRIHLDIFGRLFPDEFINQHGDPFLFEIYRRVGASEFAHTATLDNTIGGAGNSRYIKETFNWHGRILTSAIEKLIHFLRLNHVEEFVEVYCIDVVVPSYRCDFERLEAISRLAVSEVSASVQILIVVDDPFSCHLSDIRRLEDWTPNHLVRVHQNPENLGASISRNTGLASSHGDWIVLLDDDVIPDKDILNAYLGASIRHPGAKVLVGMTSLPTPARLVEHAVVASRMTFFFGIAQKMKHPPWGVTANLCVRGRADDPVWFGKGYPKSGGGEDVDYCLRVKDIERGRISAIVSVPEARAEHPFWRNISRQVQLILLDARDLVGRRQFKPITSL